MKPRTFVCDECSFETPTAEVFLQHVLDTGHLFEPSLLDDMRQKPALREEFLATLVAMQVAQSPEEMGATPLSPNESEKLDHERAQRKKQKPS